MKKNNKKCIICGTTYTFCLNCSKFDNLPRWMAMFDKNECKELFDIISNYQSNVCTKDEAKKRLIDIGSHKMKLLSPIQKITDEIISDLSEKTNRKEETENKVVNNSNDINKNNELDNLIIKNKKFTGKN